MAKFGCIWGTKWQSHVETCGGLARVAEEWQQGIADMSGEDIKHALTHCRLNATWPPSIAEFRAAAHDGASAEQRAFNARLRAQDEAIKALPSKTWAEQREIGKAHLQALKAKLRGSSALSEAATAAPGVRPDKG